VSASVGWTFNEHFAVTVDGMNLTNEKLKYYGENEDQPRGIYNNGRQFYFTLRAKFCSRYHAVQHPPIGARTPGRSFFHHASQAGPAATRGSTP
jgi:hypothetical protein